MKKAGIARVMEAGLLTKEKVNTPANTDLPSYTLSGIKETVTSK